SIAQVFEFLHPTEVRSEQRTDGAAIGRMIGMPTHIAVNRTPVEARSAADAVQALALVLLRKQIRTAVVEQYDIHLFRAVGFTFLAGSAKNTVIHCQPLPCAMCGQ